MNRRTWTYWVGGFAVLLTVAVIGVVVMFAQARQPVNGLNALDRISATELMKRCQHLRTQTSSGRESYYKGFSFSTGLPIHTIRDFYNTKCGI